MKEGRVSNFSADNQRYFILNLNETSGAKLVRADINTSATGNAPAISNINFSASALLHADDSTIAINVNVNDPQGLGDIESVRLVTLDWYINPEDSGGYYWKLGIYSKSDSLLPQGAIVETDMSVTLTPVDVFGILFDVRLEPWRNPLDPFGLYWTLGAYSRHFEPK